MCAIVYVFIKNSFASVQTVAGCLSYNGKKFFIRKEQGKKNTREKGRKQSGKTCLINPKMLQYNKVIEKRGERMPELSRFNGMVIYMQFYDTKHHNKPHIHVYYGDFEASVGIDGELMAGSLPRKQLVFIQAWLALHEEEAYAAWNKAVQGEHFEKIAPLA